MIYVVNLNYIFLEYETAVDNHVRSAKGCVMSFIEDKSWPMCFVIQVPNYIIHLCLCGFIPYSRYVLAVHSCMPRRCFGFLSL